MNQLSVIILSAGKGTRMKSELPKVMHQVASRTMLDLVIDTAQSLNPEDISLVISQDMTDFCDKIRKEHEGVNLNFVIQNERKGTAHAVSCALQNFMNQGRKLGNKVLILYGDTPLITKQTLDLMLTNLDETELCVLGFEDGAENSYGRLIIDQNGLLQKIVEFKDANSQEKLITLCNSGVMAVSGNHISDLISQVKNQNAAKEFYLTDIINIANNLHLKCSFIKTNSDEVLGVNSKVELAKVEKIMQQRLRQALMMNGVTLIDPDSVFLAYDTKIESDTIIHPYNMFGSHVRIAKKVEIKSFCHIEGAEIFSGAIIGPYARIRPQTIIAENVKIGNFVEIKKSQLSKGAKINHLSYIGDSEIGESSNIGAGTITCNYDGFEKHQTKIGKNVFIGSNSALVAPLAIADGALIAAGSVITKNVDADDLAIARSKQTNIPSGSKKFRNKKSKIKQAKNDF